MLSLQAICNYYKFPPPQLRPSWGAGCRRKNRRRLLHEKRWKFSCKKHSHSQLLMIYWLCCHISCHSDNLLALFDVFFLFFFCWSRSSFFWYGLINCLDFCCLAESANCIWRCKGEWQRCTQIDNNQKHCFRKKKRGSSLEVVWRSFYLLYFGCKTSLTKHGLGSTWGVLMLSLWSISCVIARRQQHFWMIARHSEHPPPRPQKAQRLPAKASKGYSNVWPDRKLWP